MTTRSWLRNLLASRTPRTIRKASARRQLRLELLEDRLVLSGAPNPIGPILPLHPPGASPYGMSQADLPAAEVTGLYNLILGRTPDESGLKSWTSRLQGGASPGDVARGLLASPECQASLVETYYQTFLNRSAEQPAIDSWAGVLGGDTDTTKVLIGITTSAEYQQLHPTNTAFVQSLYANVLGREAGLSEVDAWSRNLAGGASRAQVTLAFVTSTESLTQSIQHFYQVFFQRAADPGGLTNWVAQARSEPLSLVLGQMLSSPEFQSRAAAGMAPQSVGRVGPNQQNPTPNPGPGPVTPGDQAPGSPAGTGGQPFGNFFGFNQQALVSDPVTDRVTSGGQTSGGLVPMGSPWGQALVFPSVPYDAIATGTAPQPTLQLPADLVNSLNLTQGGTFQFWFQAKNPGVLLSATIPTTGPTATGAYPAPLIYINGNGKLVAGLFDQTALSVVPNQQPLSWIDPDGQTQIGAAHPLVSQVGVLDNTWHHVALVVSDQSQALYLDGLLQGMSQPQYHQTSKNLTGDNSLVVSLDRMPSPGQMISVSIAQVSQDSHFGGGTAEVARFEGWVPSNGSQQLGLTFTSPSGSPIASAVYLSASGNTPATLTFTLNGSIRSANALTIDTSYLTADSAYSYEPASTSTWSMPVNGSTMVTFGDVTGLTVGGTLVPEPTANLHPAMNYPQGFVGTVEEVALWNTSLTQSDVQSAMSGPVGSQSKLLDNLVGYFPFTQTVPGKTNEWPNDAPGKTSTFATGPSTGTLLAPVSATIPTDPFPDATRLAGARAWGLEIMTPLASPSLDLASGTTYEYKVGLAAGDQLAITVPESEQGSLTIGVEDDLGRTTSQSIQISPGSTQYLVASRTGTYNLELTWTSSGFQSSGKVDFGLIPGPLNSVMELFSSYVRGVSQTKTNTVQAYSDPALPGINPTVGTERPVATIAPNGATEDGDNATITTTAAHGLSEGQVVTIAGVGVAGYNGIFAITHVDSPTTFRYTAAGANMAISGGGTVFVSTATGAANYWPLWSDQTYFPREGRYGPDELRDAYLRLVANPGTLADFANVIGMSVTDPDKIQKSLDDAYLAVYKTKPPTPIDEEQPFPVQPAATPQDAVYEFFYNANLLRKTIYGVLTGTGADSVANLQNWVQGVINSINASAVPKTIATTIASGQAAQVQEIKVTAPEDSQKQPIGEILIDGAIAAVGAILAAIPGLGEAVDAGLVLATAGLTGSGAALGQSFVNNAFASGAGTTSFPVDVTPITNTELNYQSLDLMATSIQAGALQLWNTISRALTTDALAQSVLSNYGLLKAFSVMSGAPLSDDAANPANAVTTSLAQSSWQQMIPATFTWAPVAPDAFPTGNGQTNDWAASDPYSLGGGEGPDLNGITSADFNKDGKTDLAVANYGTSNVSLLLGTGGGKFQTATPPVSLNTKEGDGPDGARGITSGDFNGDGNPDLVVSDYKGGALSLLLGNGADNRVIDPISRSGQFQAAQTISLSPPRQDGPNGPWGIVSGDFNKDGKLDLAVAAYTSDALSILINDGVEKDGTVKFTPHTNQGDGSGYPTSIATGDFNHDGNRDLAVAYQPKGASPFNFILIYLGNGDGTFRVTEALDPKISFGPPGIVVGEFNGDPYLDVAVTSNANNGPQLDGISVFLGNGDGSFQSSANYPLATGSEGPSGIALVPTAGVGGLPNLVVTCTFSNTINVFFNQGNGTFFPAISIPVAGSEPSGITVADFAGDGLGQVAIANNKSSDVVLLSPVGVGNTATFLPGTSESNTPLSGPTDLEMTIMPKALDTLLARMNALQGGNTASLEPFDRRDLVAPLGSTPPNFMAFTSLAYPPDLVPLSLNAPGMFLSLTPATLNETVPGTDLRYTQNGAYLAGWQLLDSNGNPIAPGTVKLLFGTPSIDPTSKRPVGVDLTPANPSRPFAAFNGGWYFDAEPVNGAVTTWEDAFFNWGLGTSGYSPRNLIPQVSLIGSLPNTKTPGVSDTDIAYTLSFQPATDGPPPAPIFTSTARDAFVEGFAGQFTVKASAARQPVLSETPTDVLPQGITFNPATGVLSGTPSAGSAGTYTLHFTAKTGVGSTSQTFTLDVYTQQTIGRFVDALFQAELGHPASPDAQMAWVPVFAQSGLASVVKGIADSPEGIGYLVGGWYQTYLGSAPQGGEETGHVNDLQNGMSEEQVLSQILGGDKFYNQAKNLFSENLFTTNPDEPYVRALYNLVLKRDLENLQESEVLETLSDLKSRARQLLALDFLKSLEYREKVVRGYYADLLGRINPRQDEVDNWALSTLDVRAIRVAFEASPEFFNNAINKS